MATQKMTKQVKKMVDEVNEYLITNRVKSTGDPVFSTMCWLLSRANCYYGFNYFTLERELSGGVNDEFHHLEIYTR